MANGWSEDSGHGPSESTSIDSGTVTVLDGSSFCRSTASGDIHPGGDHGVYHDDTRVVSQWRLLVDDQAVEPLSVFSLEPFEATFLCRAASRNTRPDSTLIVERRRYVGGGMREDLVLRNFSDEPAGCSVAVVVAADFADLFDVKAGRPAERPVGRLPAESNELRLSQRTEERPRGVRIAACDAVAGVDRLSFRVIVPAHGTWQTTIHVHPVAGDTEEPSFFPRDQDPNESIPARRLRHWIDSVPIVTTKHAGLAHAIRRSRQDLGALRLFGIAPEYELPAIAAGAPWFMTLFGRDSLLASWMSLLLDPSLALGTLQTLASKQGGRTDPLTEEEPGKILHEMRFGSGTDRLLGDKRAYYGSIDSTPLFVVLLGELWKWSHDRDALDGLLPAADRALAWIEQFGDRDGDGFVEYQRATDRSLVNQGWKDSFDGVNFADGRLAEPPIALCEVQGYAYAAYLAGSRIARDLGDEEGARRWSERASMLKAEFNERFFLPDRGWYAVGLDGDKRPIDALASNMGHCLWTGIVDKDKAGRVVERLMAADMDTGWGIRTLASTMGAYNPVSYHNGSVWPHDNALIAAGLMRYGFVEEARRVAVGLIDAAEFFGGRLPELFCGFDRSEYPEPVPYPTSCSPQAWAAATPVQLLRVLLRFDPSLPKRRVSIDPALPVAFGDLRITDVPLGDARITIDVRHSELHVSGLAGVAELVHEVS